MTNITELPFSQVLDSLFGPEPVSIPLLFRLSDMSAEETAAFHGRWPQQDGDRRRMITRHLADLSEDNLQVDFSPVFAFCLQDERADVRLAALDGLEYAEHPALIAPIIACLTDDEDEEARALAAATLGHFLLLAEWGQLPTRATQAAVEALLTQYNLPETPLAVKRAALESLGNASDDRIPPLIRDAYQSGRERLQLSAIFAMGRSADPEWLPIIRQELSNPLTRIRLEAAQAAGGLGDEALVPALIELLSDEELDAQLAAVVALGQIGGDLAHEYLTELADDPDAEELHEAIQEALDEMGWLGGDIDFSLLG
jgi:HEAT repeat protein